MIKKNIASQGKPVYPLGSYLLLESIQNEHQEVVSAPASTIIDSFAFQFHQVVAELGMEEPMSRVSVRALIRMILENNAAMGITIVPPNSNSSRMSYSVDMNHPVISVLQEAGASPDQIETLLTTAAEGASRFLVRDSLSTNLLLSALDDIDMSDLLRGVTIDTSSVSAIMEDARALYAQICLSTNIDAITSTLSSSLQQRPLAGIVRSLEALFVRTTGPSIRVWLSDVERQIATVFDIHDPFDSVITANGLIRRVTSNKYSHMNGVPKLAVQYFYLTLLSQFSGSSAPLRTLDGIDWETIIGSDPSHNSALQLIQSHEILEHANRMSGASRPLHEEQLQRAGVSTSFRIKSVRNKVAPEHIHILRDFFHERLVHYMIQMVIKSESGLFHSRVNSVLDERKYARNDVLSSVITEGVRVYDIVFDSFLRASADILSLAEDPNIFWPYEDPEVQSLLDANFSRMLESFKTHFLPLEHPRSLIEPAVMLDFSSTRATFSPSVSFVQLDSSEISDLGSMIYNPVDDTYEQWWLSDLLSGVKFDVKSDIPRHILLRRQLPVPDHNYLITKPLVSSLFETQEGQRILKHPSLHEISQENMLQYFLAQGSLSSYASAISLARQLNVTPDLAQTIIDRSAIPSLGVCYTYTGPQVQHILLNSHVCPVYELNALPDVPWLDPVITLYPTALHAFEDGFNASILSLQDILGSTTGNPRGIPASDSTEHQGNPGQAAEAQKEEISDAAAEVQEAATDLSTETDPQQ